MNRVVYKISFHGSRLFYIGSALRFSERRRRHLNDLRNGRHSNRILQRCFNKFSERRLVFTILESGVIDLIGTEQKHIDSLNPQINICRKANSRLGVKHRPETIQKLTGKTHSEVTRAKLRLANLGKKQSSELIEKRISKIRGRRKYKRECVFCSSKFRTSCKTQKYCDLVCKNASQTGKPSWNAGISMVHSGSYKQGHPQSNTGRTHFKSKENHA